MDVRHCQSYRRSKLRRLHDLRPVPAADLGRFFGHNDHVSSAQGRAHRIASPPTTAVVFRGDYRAVGAGHKDRLLIRKLRDSASLAEIPLGAAARTETDGCRVEDLAIHHHVAGFLGNEKSVAIADLHISRGVFPSLYFRRDMHHDAADWRASLQLSECGLCLPDCSQLSIFLVIICFWE